MRILHLFPDLMNLYGDYGNIMVLQKHLEDQGVSVTVDKKNIGDSFSLNKYDMLYIGSGTEKNLLIALEELKKIRIDLRIFIEDGKVCLFTGNAMELLGKTINGVDGLDILPFNVSFIKERYTGDVIVKNPLFGECVGFINKCSLIKGGLNNKLFDYVFKDSNLKDNEYEGYVYKNTFGTHLIGPVLAKNPKFLVEIIRRLLGNDYPLKDIEYYFEEDSYITTLNALRGRNNDR